MKVMKVLLKVAGGIVICLIILLIILSITGLEPQDRRPGLWLKGHLTTTPITDWSFTDKYQTLEIQTRTWYLLPHSVHTICVAYGGNLYVSSVYAAGLPPYPHGRSWNEDVARDPHVRLKIGDQLFDRTLTLVTDPAERAGVLQKQAEKYSVPGETGNRRWPKGSVTYILRVMPDKP
jgi:hypothetical protein